MLSKLRLYLHHIFVVAGVNRIRTVLTAVGIFIAVTIYATGMILSDSYYNEQLAVISDIDPDSVVVKSNDSELATDEIASVVSVLASRDMVTLNLHSILSEKLSDGNYLTVLSRLHGLDSQRDFSPVITDKGLFVASRSVIVKGRLLSRADTQRKARVAVIDEATAGFVFPGEEPVGKFITIDAGINGSTNQSEFGSANAVTQLEIIGVVQSAYCSQRAADVVKNQIRQGGENVFLETNIYVPLSVLYELFSEEASNHFCFKVDQAGFTDAAARLSDFAEVRAKAGANYSVITKEALTIGLMNSLANTRFMINLIAVVLCLISGISIMSIVFFSVKERIPEIGIRKAFGATSMDIIFQFVSEIIIIAFITSIISAGITYIGCRIVTYELLSRFCIYFPIRISTIRLLLPVGIGVTEALICSLIPGVFASRIRITKALRFE